MTVSGANFNRHAANLVCTFGQTSVEAVYQSTTSVTCVVPARGAPEMVQLTVNSADGYALDFAFVDDPVVASAAPLYGPIAGGTDVLVTFRDPAVGVLSSCSCVFGDEEVVAVALGDGVSVSCTSPGRQSSLESSVPLKIVFAEDSGVGLKQVESLFTFEYYEHPLVTSVTPEYGAAAGTTHLVLGMASDVLVPSAVAVRFAMNDGDATVTDVVHPRLTQNAAEVSIVTPAAPRPGSSTVWISYDNGSNWLNTNRAFEFVPEMTLTGLSPSSGARSSTADGALMVSLSGTNFVALPRVACAFTMETSGAMTTVPASVVSSTEVRCRVPNVERVGSASVHLVLDSEVADLSLIHI